jgi:hypothetical protein
MKTIQKTLDEFIKELPEDTFLWHWMNFCESLYPKIVRKNLVPFFVTGLSLLTITHRCYIRWNKPLPGNFYIALTGRPASGKGRVLDCLRTIISGIEWIKEIPTGSAEAIEVGIEKNRFGYLIWDEIGEIAEKSGDYLHRVKYVLNRAYYLDPIVREKTTKKSVSIPAHSYYINTVFAGLEEDWKAIERQFLGGFERRFIALKVERARLPFEREEVNREGWKHAFWLWDYIKKREGELWYVEPPSLEKLQERVMQLDDKYWSCVEEYSYKIAAALLLNDVSKVIMENDNIDTISHGGHKVIKVTRSHDIFQELMGLNVTNGTIYYMGLNVTLLPKNSSDVSSDSGVTHPQYDPWYFCDVIDAIITPLFREIEVSDESIIKLNTRLEELRKNPQDLGFMSKKQFVREVLKTANAQYYLYVLSALQDAGLIRVISGSIFGRRGELVVYDLKKRLCANCEHLQVCAAKAKKERRVLDIWQAESCENFKLAD